MALGELLITSGTITEDQLNRALQTQREIGGQIGHILTKLGFTTEREIVDALAEQMQIPIDMLDDFEPDPELIAELPRELLEKHQLLPLRKEGGTLLIGMTDPSDFAAVDAVRMRAKMSVDTVLIPLGRTRDILERLFPDSESEAGESDGETQSDATAAPARPAASGATRSPRHLLRSVIRELESDGTEDAGEGREGELEALPARELLFALMDALLDTGILKEDDLAAALTARREKTRRG